MKKHIYCQHSFETEVPFFDVDAMHIVWHGNYVKYLETARCAFLSSIGYDYNEMGRQGYSWPIVQMNLKYIRPARFGQKSALIWTSLKSKAACVSITPFTMLKPTKN